MPCPENTVVSGIVTGFLDTPEGQIAFVKVPVYGPVTISLSHDCWQGGNGPQRKEKVVIEGLTMFEQGWRACKARRYEIRDQNNGL